MVDTNLNVILQLSINYANLKILVSLSSVKFTFMAILIVIIEVT